MGGLSKILLIEDSITQAKQLSTSLSQHNLELVVAQDGPEGLRMVDTEKPDLIILDVHLPEMDGFQVCRRLKRDPNTADIPVIMLTSADSADDALTGLDAGADDYIPKDAFATENLLAALGTIGLLG